MPDAAEVEIREADLHDPVHAAGIVSLLVGYAREPGGGGRAIPDAVQQRLIPALAREPHAHVWVALHAADPVGVAVCFRGFSTFAARPVLNVHDLAVRPDVRGRGVGGRLLEAVETHARRLGCCKLTLEVHGDNHHAQSLYARFGFSGLPSSPGESPTLFLEKRFDVPR